MMMEKSGIAELSWYRPTLEERLEALLSKVPSDAVLKDTYIDKADRLRVRRRTMIAAVLDAIFEQRSPEVSDEGLEVEVGIKPDVFSELADARRDFIHDAERLDHGAPAELVLKTTKTDDDLTTKPLTAQKKELIVWLILAHLWHKTACKRFSTQTSVFHAAAKATGRTSATLRTELSHFKTQMRASIEELAYFWDLAKSVQELAKTAGDYQMAFCLLLPAAKVLSEAAIPKAKTASSES